MPLAAAGRLHFGGVKKSIPAEYICVQGFEHGFLGLRFNGDEIGQGALSL
jgi:hypothetical protein